MTARTYRPKDREPNSARTLDLWVRDKAEADGVTLVRLRRGVSFMVISAVLGQIVDDAGLPLFLLKGGVAMELRFGLSARPSKDYDAAFRESLDTLLTRLDAVLRDEHHGFNIARTDVEPIGETGAVRMKLKLTYHGKPWSTVVLEVSAAEGHSGDDIDWVHASPDLGVFGLSPCDEVACLTVPYQLAQKLHACTDPNEAATAKRGRDLVDIQLLEQLLGPEERAAARAACIDVFTGRGKQPWPPEVRAHLQWVKDYADAAADAEFPLTDAEAAAEAVRELIHRIDRS